MTTIRLYGDLATRFGDQFEADVKSVAEALRCLMSNLPGLKAFLLDDRRYAVYVNGRNIDQEQLLDPSGAGEIRIVPVLEGAANSKGIIQTITGIVLVVVGVATGQAWLVNIGISLTISGLVSLLMPIPKPPTIAQEERSDNFLLSGGSRNDTINGLPIPVGYGRLKITPRPISGGISTKDY